MVFSLQESSPRMELEAEKTFIPTLNKMGYMTATLDPVSEAFVNFASQNSRPAADIGAAYGVATLAALSKGATVVANDLDARHLDILEKRATEEERKRLTLQCSSFPQETFFPSESLSCVLLCRILHFLDGPLLIKGAAKVGSWLVRGGKVFVVAETPYLGNFKKFIPEYERRKAEKWPWPGFLDDVPRWAPERSLQLPSAMHFLDPDILRLLFKDDFEIEWVGFINRRDFPQDLRLDGRESVGLIGQKL